MACNSSLGQVRAGSITLILETRSHLDLQALPEEEALYSPVPFLGAAESTALASILGNTTFVRR